MRVPAPASESIRITATCVLPEIDDGLVKLGFAAVVLNDDIGRPAFFVNRPLGGFAAIEFFLGPPRRRPVQPQISGAVDHQDDIANGPPAGFEQKGGVEDHGRFALRSALVADVGPAAGESADEASVPGTGARPPRHLPSANTRLATADRSTLPSAAKTASPQRSRSASCTSASSASTAWPVRSASRSAAPKSTSISATSDLPLAIAADQADGFHGIQQRQPIRNRIGQFFTTTTRRTQRCRQSHEC